MLWSLVKILVFIAVIAAMTIGAGYLLESGDGLQVTVAGTEYTFSAIQSVIAAIVLVVAVWIGLKVLSFLVATIRFLKGDETAISRFFTRKSEQRGYKALADGMMALASGEAKTAMAQASKAERFLRKPEITNLLTAQAAEMAGDTRKAEETYKQLVQHDSTRFVGVRGIMKQKLAAGDTDTARQLAEKAFEMKPRHEETQDILLNLQAKAQDWAGARNTLNAKLKYGALPRDVYTRRQAVLALSEASGGGVSAQEKAIEANRLSPDLVPAAAMAAKSHIEAGKPKNATRLLKKAWDVQPHPDLAAAFAAIVPDETPVQRLKRFQTLTSSHREHPETKLVLAELHLVAEDFPEARRVLQSLVDGDGDARAFTLMAAAEKGAGATDSVVQGWLTRALSAPRGPQWICDNCNHVNASWAPVCESCESFDTLSWKTPPQAELLPSTGAGMLPFIGADPKPEDVEPEPEAPEMIEVEVVDPATASEPTPEPEATKAN